MNLPYCEATVQPTVDRTHEFSELGAEVGEEGGPGVKNLDFTSLRLFAVVVEHGNIAQASRVNGIAASAISKRISDLEDQIGVRLIHRLRDGIEPTAAGQELYKYVKEIGLTVDRLQASLSEFTKG